MRLSLAAWSVNLCLYMTASVAIWFTCEYKYHLLIELDLLCLFIDNSSLYNMYSHCGLDYSCEQAGPVSHFRCISANSVGDIDYLYGRIASASPVSWTWTPLIAFSASIVDRLSSLAGCQFRCQKNMASHSYCGLIIGGKDLVSMRSAWVSSSINLSDEQVSLFA